MPDREEKATPSRIEIAKALRHMKAIATRNQYEAIHKVLGLAHDEELSRAVSGLGEEDEFLLMCVLMGTATHLAPLEQRPSVAGGRSAPDLLARFQPGYYPKTISSSHHSGYTCFVEVKSTKKDTFHFGGKHLHELREFAAAFQLPLVFAIRFLRWHGVALWVIVEDKDRTRRSLSVSVSDWISGLRPVLWNEEGYMLFPGTYFQATYGPRTTQHGIWHPKYGEQVAFQVVTNKGRFEFDGEEGDIVAGFFESYNLREEKIERHGENTYVAYVPQNSTLSVVDLIYGMNRLPRDEDGHLVYDAGTVLRKLADGQKYPLITREFVTYFAKHFCHLGALGVVGYGKPEDTYARWLAIGGQAVPPSPPVEGKP